MYDMRESTARQVSAQTDLQDGEIPGKAAASTAIRSGRKNGNGGQDLGHRLDRYPLVLLVSESNEFVQAARTLLKILGVSFKEVQSTGSGATLSAVDASPRVYVGGQCIGGAIDLFAQYIDGSLSRRLEALGIGVKRRWTFDPSQMLMEWLLTRKRQMEVGDNGE